MRLLLATLLMLSGSVISHAQPDSWKASSDTATAVTGDITLHADRIVFANGESIRLVPVTGRQGVFKADPSANPSLINGNRLCNDDVTYVVLAQDSKNVLYMKVFEGPDVPAEAVANPLPQDGACAIYNYGR